MSGSGLFRNRFSVLKRLPIVFRLLSINIFTAIATLCTSVILARSLEPEGRGILAAIILWPMLLSHLALMGVHLYLGRIAGQACQPVGALYRHGLAAISLTVAFATAGWITIDLATPAWPIQEDPRIYWVYLLLCASIIPFSAWNALQVQVELGRGAMLTYNIARTGFTMTHLILIAGLYLLGLTEPVYFLACFALSAALASLLSSVIISKSHATGQILPHIGEIDAPQVLTLASTYRSAWPFAFSTATVALMATADRLVVSVAFDAQTMGYYIIAIAMTQVQGVVNESIAPLFYAHFARHPTLKDADLDWLARRTRQSTAINCAIALGLLVIAPSLLSIIFGSAYSEAANFAAILIPAVALRSAMRSFEEILKGGNKPLGQAFTIATMSIVFAAGAAAAAWYSSAKGVAFAVMLANLVGLTLMVRRVTLYTGLGFGELLLPRPRDMLELASEIARSFK